MWYNTLELNVEKKEVNKMIQVSSLAMQFDGKYLFKDVNLKFTKGNCYGVIGLSGVRQCSAITVSVAYCRALPVGRIIARNTAVVSSPATGRAAGFFRLLYMGAFF